MRQMVVDLLFPARGESPPTDHAYPLYAALSAVVPAFHAAGGPRFAPLTGEPAGGGRLRLNERSVLRVRLPADAIPQALPLAGRRLEVAGCGVRLGVPSVRPMEPAAALFAPVVLVKPDVGLPRPPTGERPRAAVEAGPFVEAVRRKLAAAGLAGDVSVPVRPGGKRGPEPCRRVVRVKGRALVGYAVVVSGLSAADSLKLQADGLGGRTRIGCGFFVPAREGMT